GWLTATAFVMNHFVFKSLLFLAAAGVIYRVKTRNMYEMGGLIKKMPISFISVMIGIIAVSGVPPLTGFGGKWLSYNAIILKGWYFQGFLVSIAGLIAFLYLFRLVYTVFLGQPKTEHRNVKEAPIWYIIPQIVLLGAIMVFSVGPNILLKPIGRFLVSFFPDQALQWSGNVAHTSLGYWSPIMIMNIAGGIFAIIAVWLFIITRKAKKVKQFNIVFAAERPFTPETTHFAHNFFAHYNRAIGWMVTPHVTRFWNFVTDAFHSTADFVRRFYTGNGQTYAIQLLAYVVVLYFITTKGGR
ncbi:NADH-quinone oxidoreductase subunit F, partial [Myxococcota bacterium]|nr:NADH-quinone oxidoreductase subunit F [Myxococcota bacterium]